MAEIELKLSIDPTDLDRLLASTTMAGRGVTRNLESVYWDTPDLRLMRRAVTLRVRRVGRRHIQTVKDAGVSDGIVSSRGEWETPVGGPAPDLSAVTDATALDRLGPIAPQELAPVFVTRVRRVTRMVLLQGGARVEVAVDLGDIRTPDGRSEPLAEIEFELKAGEPHAVYDVALAVAAEVPVHLERRTKAERGYALAAGIDVPAQARRAETPSIDANDSVEVAMAAILREGLIHVLENGPAVRGGDPHDGVHQMRVGVRRLRSALSLFGPLLPDAQRDTFTTELRWLAGELAAARDWDVFLDSLLAPVDAVLGRDGGLAMGFAALAERGQAQRDLGHARARDAVASAKFTRLALSLGAWIEGRGWRAQAVTERSARLFDPVGVASATLLARRHRRALKRGAGFARLPTEERHRVRIALKRLRYAGEFFRSVHDGKTFTRFNRRLAAFLDRLGHLNDVATAERLIADLEGSEVADDAGSGWRFAAGAVIGWHARGLVESEAQLVADWNGFADAEPFWAEDR
jgi:triphosphatase